MGKTWCPNTAWYNSRDFFCISCFRRKDSRSSLCCRTSSSSAGMSVADTPADGATGTASPLGLSLASFRSLILNGKNHTGYIQ